LHGILGVELPWIWRFTHGFDYMNLLTFTVIENKKERIIKDPISKLAHRMGCQYVS